MCGALGELLKAVRHDSVPSMGENTNEANAVLHEPDTYEQMTQICITGLQSRTILVMMMGLAI